MSPWSAIFNLNLPIVPHHVGRSFFQTSLAWLLSKSVASLILIPPLGAQGPVFKLGIKKSSGERQSVQVAVQWDQNTHIHTAVPRHRPLPDPCCDTVRHTAASDIMRRAWIPKKCYRKLPKSRPSHRYSARQVPIIVFTFSFVFTYLSCFYSLHFSWANSLGNSEQNSFYSIKIGPSVPKI